MGRERRATRAMLAGASVLMSVTMALAPSGVRAAPVEDPFSPVLHQVLAGDLVMAGNSNLVSAGGYRPAQSAMADVDGDTTRLCVTRLYVPAACGENSSSATLDIPFGARIVEARLYVDTTLTPVAGPIRARLDGPAAGFDYTELSADTPGIAKVGESAGTSDRDVMAMRQAVWDVTDYVRTGGAGTYTVADIMFERAGAYMPYASWTIVAAYELDPAADLGAMTPEQQARFSRRAITWDDGFTTIQQASVGIEVGGYDVPPGVPIFAKAFHLAANPRSGGPDSLLFAGQPVGNSASPGDAPAPGGVPIGTDPACNSTTDIVNESICVLGEPVATKSPGAADFLAARDGVTASSGSGVDFDVTRVPDRYFVPGSTRATLELQSWGRWPIGVGMLAVSVDLPAADAGATP